MANSRHPNRARQGDKVMQAAQSARIESGAVWFPRRASWLGEFQTEVMGFPRGRSDDQVDALSQALQYISDSNARRGGWGAVKGLY